MEARFLLYEVREKFFPGLAEPAIGLLRTKIFLVSSRAFFLKVGFLATRILLPETAISPVFGGGTSFEDFLRSLRILRRVQNLKTTYSVARSSAVLTGNA